MTKTGVIYKLQIGETIYVGQTMDSEKRRKRHLSTLKNGKHSNKKLQEAYNTVNAELAFEILQENVLEIDLLEFEQQWTETLSSVNCLRPGGARPGAGRPPDPNKQITITIQLPPDLLEQVQTMSLEQHQSVSAIIRTLILKGLKS
jgi:GIY-YIG catalytic domain/Ribbon-helix-helix protein, copG family